MLASRPSLVDVAIDHLDGPDDEDFAGIAGFEERIAFTEGDFRLIDFDNPSSGSRSGSTIDRRNFCVSSQAVL